MTISNKFFFMTALAIGMNTIAYDAVGLKKEAIKGLNFAQTLEQQPTTATNTKVAQWLKKGLAHENYAERFDNTTVIEIARIIDNNSTTEATVTALLMVLVVLADQKAASALIRAEGEGAVAALVLMSALLASIFLYENMPALLRMARYGDIIESHQFHINGIKYALTKSWA